MPLPGKMTTRLARVRLNVARFLGEEAEWGTAAPGRRADLVLLDAMPLVNVGNARRVRAVVVAGRLLRREDLNVRLAALPTTQSWTP